MPNRPRGLSDTASHERWRETPCALCRRCAKARSTARTDSSRRPAELAQVGNGLRVFRSSSSTLKWILLRKHALLCMYYLTQPAVSSCCAEYLYTSSTWVTIRHTTCTSGIAMALPLAVSPVVTVVDFA